MKGRPSNAPFRIPGMIGGLTAFALIAALLFDGVVETLSVLILAAVVVYPLSKLAVRP